MRKRISLGSSCCPGRSWSLSMEIPTFLRPPVPLLRRDVLLTLPRENMRICGQGSRSVPLIATELGLLLLIRVTSLLFLAFLSLGSSQCVWVSAFLSALSLDDSRRTRCQLAHLFPSTTRIHICIKPYFSPAVVARDVLYLSIVLYSGRFVETPRWAREVNVWDGGCIETTG